MDATALVRVLAEPVRLKVFAALVLGADSTTRAAQFAGVTAREAAAAVYRLTEAGLAEPVGERLVARTEVFADLARAAAPERQPEDYGYADPKLAGLVGTFVRDGHLVGLPGQRSRRVLILEHVAQSFEPGVDYPEAEVNAMLAELAEGGTVDHVTLRRYLIDEQLLRREAGVYRRSGGPVDV
ncbi:MAG TPA: DUF2087 domain-containing protein [Pseudonocardiaceae bacterium]|nr:DUF2087 domain-containing protein [Pseudonocardiaceae bacterium]